MSCGQPGELLESVIADFVQKELANRDGGDIHGDDMADVVDKPGRPSTQDVHRRVDAFL
jgi:hypothetical protein